MNEPIGIFTISWRLIKQVPNILRQLWNMFAPWLGKGSLLGQILWIVFVIKVVMPVFDYLWDNIPVWLKWILDNFEKQVFL